MELSACPADVEDLDRSTLCLKSKNWPREHSPEAKTQTPSGKYMMYRHDQIGWLMVIVVGVAAVFVSREFGHRFASVRVFQE